MHTVLSRQVTYANNPQILALISYKHGGGWEEDWWVSVYEFNGLEPREI